MISFTPRPTYCQGNIPRYPLDRRLGGSQSLSGCCGEEKRSFAITGSRLFLGRPVPTLTEISRLTTAIPNSRQRVVLQFRSWAGVNNVKKIRSYDMLQSTLDIRPASQVRACGICGGQSGTGADFLQVLRFPLSILIPPTAPHSSIIRGWYNRPNSGRRTKWTQSHPTLRN
jgi:hypothetical protein